MANSRAFGRRSKVKGSRPFGSTEPMDRSGSVSGAADCLRAYWRADVDLNREALGAIPVLSLLLGIARRFRMLLYAPCHDHVARNHLGDSLLHSEIKPFKAYSWWAIHSNASLPVRNTRLATHRPRHHLFIVRIRLRDWWRDTA